MAIDTTDETDPIDIGSAEWGKDLNKLLKANMITTTDWTNAGVVMLNGFKAVDPAGMIYKTIKTDSFEILTVKGSIKYPAMASGQALDCLQIPTSAFPANKDFWYLHDSAMIWGDQLINLDFNSAAGKVRFVNESMRGNKTLKTGQKLISLTVGF